MTVDEALAESTVVCDPMCKTCREDPARVLAAEVVRLRRQIAASAEEGLAELDEDLHREMLRRQYGGGTI